MGDPAEPERERTDLRMQLDLAQRRLESLDQRFRAGDAGEVELDPGVARTAASLSVVP